MLAKKEVAEALGGGGPGTKAANDALTSWQFGDAVPGPLASAIDKMCKAQHHPNAQWGPDDLAKIKAIKMAPAIHAVKKVIEGALQSAGLDSDRKAVDEAFNAIGNGLNAESPGLADRALLAWRFRDDIPPLAVKLLRQWIQKKLQMRQQEQTPRGMRSGSGSYGDGM